MKKLTKNLIFLISLVLITRLPAQETDHIDKEGFGFVDKNHDGMNDLFTDANGDGINDISGQSYPHHFSYKDTDGDKINDLWKDADGDGVNDLLGKIQKDNVRWVDQDGDGIVDEEVGHLRGKSLKAHVLDMDKDGRNDITGIQFSGRDLKGQQYGMVDEAGDRTDPSFQDLDGDGKNDGYSGNEVHSGKGGPPVDMFIDADGDGIADDRGWGNIRGNRKSSGKKQ